MKKERAGIRQLKAHLSEYVRRVRDGTTVLITDRGEVVAELSRPTRVASKAEKDPDRRVLQKMIDEGKATPPQKPADATFRRWLRTWKGGRLPQGTTQKWIDDDREDK